jgi:hypothetical protein
MEYISVKLDELQLLGDFRTQIGPYIFIESIARFIDDDVIHAFSLTLSRHSFT